MLFHFVSHIHTYTSASKKMHSINNNNDTVVAVLCQMTCCFSMSTSSSTTVAVSNVRVDAWPDLNNSKCTACMMAPARIGEEQESGSIIVHSIKRRLGKIALAIPSSSSSSPLTTTTLGSQQQQQHVTYNFKLERPWQNNDILTSTTNGNSGGDSVRRVIHAMTQYATKHIDFANAVRVCVHNTQLAQVRNMWTRSNMNPIAALFRLPFCILYDDDATTTTTTTDDDTSTTTTTGLEKCLVAMFYGHLNHNNNACAVPSSSSSSSSSYYDHILPFNRPDERVPPHSAIALSVNMFQILRIIHVLCTINSIGNKQQSTINIFERYTTTSDSSSSTFLEQVAIPALCMILDHNDNGDDDDNSSSSAANIAEFHAFFTPSCLPQVHENVRDILMANFPNDPRVRSSPTIINYSKKQQQRVKGQQRLMTDFFKTPPSSYSSTTTSATTIPPRPQQRQLPPVSQQHQQNNDIAQSLMLPPPLPPIADVSMRDSPAASTEIRGPSKKNTIPTDMATICSINAQGGGGGEVIGPTMQTLRGFPCPQNNKKATTRSADEEFAYFKQRSEAIMAASNAFMQNCLTPVLLLQSSSSSSSSTTAAAAATAADHNTNSILVNNLKQAAAASSKVGSCAIILQELMDQHNCILANHHHHNHNTNKAQQKSPKTTSTFCQ